MMIKTKVVFVASMLLLAAGVPALAQVITDVPRANLAVDPRLRMQVDLAAQVAELSSQVVSLKRDLKEQASSQNARAGATDGKLAGLGGKLTDIDARTSTLRQDFDHHWHLYTGVEFGTDSATTVPTMFCMLKGQKKKPLEAVSCAMGMGPTL